MEHIKPVKCVDEEEALLAFLSFLETVGHRVVLVGLDEETVGVLLQKLENQHKEKFWSLIAGYIWWKRVFNNTNAAQM